MKKQLNKLSGKSTKLLTISAIAATTLQATPMGQIGGSNGIVYGEDKKRLVLNYQTLSKEDAYNGDKKVADPKNRSMDGKVLNVTYRQGLGYDMDIRFQLPYISKNMTQTIPKGPKKGQQFSMKNDDIGDMKMVLRYNLLNQKKGDPLFLSIGGGLELPTGSTNKTFNTPMGAKTAKDTMTMQTGSGSVDYIFEIGATKMMPKSRIDFHTLYQINNEGKHDFEYGNKLVWNLSYGYELTPKIGLTLGVDGRKCDKQKQNGITNEASGGMFTFLTPSVSYKINKSIDISAGYSKMIKKDNNYDLATKTGGLSEDDKFLFRLGYNF